MLYHKRRCTFCTRDHALRPWQRERRTPRRFSFRAPPGSFGAPLFAVVAQPYRLALLASVAPATCCVYQLGHSYDILGANTPHQFGSRVCPVSPSWLLLVRLVSSDGTALDWFQLQLVALPGVLSSSPTSSSTSPTSLALVTVTGQAVHLRLGFLRSTVVSPKSGAHPLLRRWPLTRTRRSSRSSRIW